MSIQFDSGSYTLPGLPPTLLLETVVGGLANTSIYIGSNQWGPFFGALGASLTLSDNGTPPYPVIIVKEGVITEWTAQFEALATVGANLSILDPLGLLGIQQAQIHAALLYAPALTASPASIRDISNSFMIIDDILLGEIPLAGVFSSFHADQILAQPKYVSEGDYLLVQFYIYCDPIIASSVNGFHMQANVNLN